MNNSSVPDFSALDLVRMLFGIVITTAGIAAGALFLGRLKRRDYSLLYFGLAATLYGVRLFINGSSQYMHGRWDRASLLITLVVGIPFALFVTETGVSRWKKFVWWIIGGVAALAAFGFARALLHLDLGIVDRLNSVMALMLVSVMLVLLFVPFKSANRDMGILRVGFLVFLLFAIYNNLVGIKAIPGSNKLEFIGLTFFIGCLAYVAAVRTQRNEQRLLSLNKELEIAREIQSGLLPEKTLALNGLTAASSYVPASSVAGDFYDFLLKDGGMGVLIADVSGHGVPAALSASMVKVAIRAQHECADDPAQVLTGLNSILCGNLQGQFVTAGYLFLDPKRGALAYAGAGHPPLLAWRAAEKKVESLEENGLMLGLFPEGTYKSVGSALAPGDRFVLYTDGILEAPSLSGEEFGMDRLKDFVSRHSGTSAQELCDAMVQHVAAWCGNGVREQHDDLTLIVIDYKTA